MIEFTLPFPPSVNNLYANRTRSRTATTLVGGRPQLVMKRAPAGRRMSASYRKWRTNAGWHLAAQRVKPVSGRVDIEIDLSAGDKRRRDGSNFIKAIEDLLVAHGVLRDDDSTIVRGVTARWIEAGKAGATVRIKPAA